MFPEMLEVNFILFDIWFIYCKFSMIFYNTEAIW